MKPRTGKLGVSKRTGKLKTFSVREKSGYTLQLFQKSDFQPLTTKSDNIGHPTVKTGQIWPLGGFEDGFPFCEN